MSDSVTNVEIEDVLSSIRRLVSVETGRKGDAPPAPRGGSATKLVLTDHYRVGAPEQAAPPRPKASSRDEYTRTLERRIAELEAAVNAQQTEFEPDGSEDTSQHRPTRYLFPVNADTPPSVAPPQVQASPAEEAPFAEVQEEAAVDHGDMWSDAGVSSISQHPDADAGFNVTDTDSRRDARDDQSDIRLSDEDPVIDEDMLRDMVAEIVRDELQGALGERITRNVRKLVRREIMRAISIRDFE